MSEALWIALVAVAIPGFVSLVVQFASIRSARNEKEATAASELTGAALKMVNELQEENERTRIQIKGLSAQIKELQSKLDLANEMIEYLWNGTLENIRFMEEAGMTPPFKPSPKYRGDDLSWLDKDK